MGFWFQTLMQISCSGKSGKFLGVFFGSTHLQGVSEIINNFASCDRYTNLRCGKYSSDVPGSTDVDGD